MKKPLIMSDQQHDNDDDDTLLLERTKPRLKKPPLFKVVLLNDDYTPMEFVVYVLERFFGLNHSQSVEIMLTVHRKGVAVVGVFAFEIAETKVAQVHMLARQNDCPLMASIEPEDDPDAES